ncbi:hypothetical protein E2C01_001431 [Portunus trituberculatus]|uniref:Uncharacterized protein n=1 Tax=Portunus trituberculatus TaxID=210409 RepID=A0A5B7CH62_PORTR|nr:hypothetical protein [Portunus trituberculatus]
MNRTETAQPLPVPDRMPPRSASSSEEDLDMDYMDIDEEQNSPAMRSRMPGLQTLGQVQVRLERRCGWGVSLRETEETPLG